MLVFVSDNFRFLKVNSTFKGKLLKEQLPQFSSRPAASAPSQPGYPSHGYYPGTRGGAYPAPWDGATYPPRALQYPVPMGVHPAPGLEGTTCSQPNAPMVIYAQNEVDGVSDYCIPNIIACFFCCWCLGCIAILNFHECQNAKRNHDVREARRLSQDAKKLLVATIVVGIVFGIIGGIVNALLKAGLFK